jgi:hypothetical protein
MKFIHITCLQEWLKNRLITRETTKAVYYCWNELKCELCQMNLPTSVTVLRKTYDLVTFVKPDTPFIVLESIKRVSGLTNGLHLIKVFEHEPIGIGRSHESEVRLSTDISMSRNHATIRLLQEGFLLEDIGSKFGTLLHAKGPLVLLPGKSIAIQCGRTIVLINLPDVWSLRRLCAKIRCCRPRRPRIYSREDEDDAEKTVRSSRPFKANHPTSSEPGQMSMVLGFNATGPSNLTENDAQQYVRNSVSFNVVNEEDRED